MGPEPAVNAVYYNRIMELEETARAEFIRQKRAEFQQDIDIHRLASEMLVDDMVPPSDLRAELVKRLAYAETKAERFPARRNGIFPV
jgi:acetyl-CoA carboxylase carboxyltransferase component